MASRFVCDLCGAVSRDPALVGKLHSGCSKGAGVWLVDGSPATVQCNGCGELDPDPAHGTLLRLLTTPTFDLEQQ